MNGFIVYRKVHAPVGNESVITYLKGFHRCRPVYTDRKAEAKRVGLTLAIICRLVYSLSVWHS